MVRLPLVSGCSNLVPTEANLLNPPSGWRACLACLHAGLIQSWLAWLLCAGLAVSAHAEEFAFAQPYFETVGDGESLPGGIIPALMQDARGWLWIGTQKGLVRYDGYRFRRFAHDPHDPFSLAGDFVRCLWPDRGGRIWIGTVSDGLSRFDPLTEQFENFRHDPKNADSISGGQIYAMATDAQDGLWLATNEGLDYLAAGSKRFRHFRHDPEDARSLIDNRVHTVMIDRDGRVWVGTGSGLQRMTLSGQHFELIASDPADPASLAHNAVWCLLQAHDGKIWLGTFSHGAAWIDPNRLQLHRLPLDPARSDAVSHGWVDALLQPQPGQIWLATAGGGINIVDAMDGKVLRVIRHDSADGSSLALDNLGALLKDQAGWMWVGSWGRGLQRINTSNTAIVSVRHGQSHPEGLSHPNVYGILEQEDGSILVGTDGKGIDILDRKQGVIGGYRPEPGKPGSLVDATITALAKTADGTLWAGTRQAGVLQLPHGSQQWRIVPGAPGPQIYRLLVARNGDVWAATNTGVARWQVGSRQFEVVDQIDGSPMQATSHALAQDPGGRIWVGTNAGLWVQEPGEMGLVPILADPARPSSLVSDAILGLLVDHLGQLWVSTANGLERLRQWDGQVAAFDHINEMLGKPAVELGKNLLEDRQNRIWTGEYVLDPKRLTLYPLSRADGLDIGGNWIGAAAQTRDGLLLFGGTLGLAIIHPERFQPWLFQPPLVATELKIDGKALPAGRLGQPGQALQLSPHERNFAVEFTALDYSQPGKNRYRYRLQGYDADWIDVDADHRSASYGNLWPGRYLLQVQGSNRLGELSSHELHIPIQVLPAFWQTVWFVALALLGLGGAAYHAYRWRMARMEHQARHLQTLIAARTADILKLADIGQELTATLDTEQAFERVYTQVRARLDAHVFGIGIVERDVVRFEYLIEAGKRQATVEYPLKEAERPAVWCVSHQRELIVARRDDLLKYLTSILPVKSGEPTESIVFMPLIAEKRVMGCLTVQSQTRDAFSDSQLEFLRVLASYTAIAIANSSAHRNLLATQQQLVQQEKMAMLGQLVANVAHEINTPIGAVKASGGNIAHALEETLRDIPRLFHLLGPDDQARFQTLIGRAKISTELISSREERSMARELAQKLEQDGLDNAHHKAMILVQLRAEPVLAGILPLLHHPEADFILKTAHGVANIINNTSNINLAVARVSKIVFALKTYSRGGHVGELIETDLRESLETVVTIYQHQIRHGTTLVREYDAVPPLRCQPDELNQVWTNLIHNALQAMNFQGTLTLGIHRVGNEVVVSVGDTGCGIPEAIQSRIFDAFFTTKPPGEGSGLGLDIVKKIVEKHHGRIEVVSQVGVGTTFSVHLPYPGAAESTAPV